MSLLSIDTLCDACNTKADAVVPRTVAADWDTRYICDNCGRSEVRRVWSAPNLTKESYPDGYKRGGDYQLLKESVKIQKQAASAKGETKKELLKAAGELRKASRHEKGKPK
jgi:hypothetical protein